MHSNFTKTIKLKIQKGLGLELTRISLVGAAAFSKDLLVWPDKLGIKINEGYGITENLRVSNIGVPGINRYALVGKILHGTEIVISESGEVLTRSKSMMQGYCKSLDQRRVATLWRYRLL